MPLSCFLTLHLVDGRSDFPLGTSCDSRLLNCDHVARLHLYPFYILFLYILRLPVANGLLASVEDQFWVM